MKIDKKRIKIIIFCVLISLSQITYTCLDYNATITIIAKGLRYFIYIALVVINLTEFKKEDFNIKYIFSLIANLITSLILDIHLEKSLSLSLVMFV